MADLAPSSLYFTVHQFLVDANLPKAAAKLLKESNTVGHCAVPGCGTQMLGLTQLD